MTKLELAKILRDERFDPLAYELNGGYPSEKYCLEAKDGIWSVYYSERGEQSMKRDFLTEEEACDYFLNWIRQSRTARL